MTTSIQVPRALKKRIKAFGSLQEVNRWGSAIDDSIDEIITSLQQTRQSIRELTRSTGVSSVGLHASTHRPATGTDPLNTAAPSSVLGGTSVNATGAANFFARSDHNHDVGTAAHSGGYATAATEGAGNTLLRADGVLKFPQAIMSLANGATFTLTDDGTDMHIACSLGGMDFNTSNNKIALPFWTGCGDLGDALTGSILRFAGAMSKFGTSLNVGIDAALSFDTATTLSSTYRTGRYQFSNPAIGSIAWSAATQRILDLEFGAEPTMSGTQTITERSAIKMTMRGMRGTSVTITGSFGILADTWPLSNTNAGTYTNAAFAKVQIPTIGSTIRRGFWLTSTTSNVGTASANTEGFYCEDITIGTAQRVNYYAEGATTGTPTDVYGYYLGTAHAVGTNRYGYRATGASGGTLAVGFYADAHSGGTTKWSFYGNDESRMNGVQQDDNAKDVFGTGRDAELYYDGTDFVCDPDVVGSGSFDIRGPLKCDSITNDTGLAAGVFTPTRSAEANLDANVTMSEAQYARVGNTVTMSGRFTANPTAAGATSFEFSLPVASNIGAAEDLAGVAFCGAIAGQGAELTGSVANNTAVVSWIAVDVTNQTWSYSLSYQVI